MTFVSPEHLRAISMIMPRVIRPFVGRIVTVQDAERTYRATIVGEMKVVTLQREDGSTVRLRYRDIGFRRDGKGSGTIRVNSTLPVSLGCGGAGSQVAAREPNEMEEIDEKLVGQELMLHNNEKRIGMVRIVSVARHSFTVEVVNEPETSYRLPIGCCNVQADDLNVFGLSKEGWEAAKATARQRDYREDEPTFANIRGHIARVQPHDIPAVFDGFDEDGRAVIETLSDADGVETWLVHPDEITLRPDCFGVVNIHIGQRGTTLAADVYRAIEKIAHAATDQQARGRTLEWLKSCRPEREGPF